MNNVKVQKKKQKSANVGLIFAVLYSLYAYLYKKAKTSLASRIMCTYDKTEERFSECAIKALKDRFLPSDKILSVRRKISKRLCRNIFAGFTTRIIGNIVSCRCRDIGIFMLSFGIYSVLSCAIKPYIFSVPFDNFSLVSSILCILLSVPLICQKISFGEYATHNKPLRFIVFDMFGARDYEIYSVRAKQAPSGVSIIIGMLFGLCSLFTATHTVIGAFLSLLATVAILRMPEVGVVILFLIFPFARSEILFLTAVLSLISYTFKVLQLKRTLKFAYSDFWVLLLAVCVLFGGIVSPGGSAGFSHALYMSVGILCLFLSKNLMRSFEWIKRCFMTCILSLTLTCLYSVVSILTSGDHGIIRSVIACAVTGESSVFQTNSQFAVYIAVMLPFVMLVSTFNKRFKSENVYYTVILLAVISLIFTFSAGGYITAGAIICLFLFTRNERTFARGVIGAFPVVACVSVFSQFKGTNLFQTFLGGIDLASANADAIKNIISYPLGGMGITDVSVTDASFYLIFAESLGIPCLILFISVVFRFFRICTTSLHGGFTGFATSEVSPYIIAPIMATIAMLIYGALSGIIFSADHFLLMFLIMGLGEGIADFSKEDALLASGFGLSV